MTASAEQFTRLVKVGDPLHHVMHEDTLRIRGLAEELGADPFEVALRELASYRTALRVTRAEAYRLRDLVTW